MVSESNCVSKRFLLIKHGALGDLIQSIDAIAGLRAAYPHAWIALMTDPSFDEFVKLIPWVDEIIHDSREPIGNIAASLRIRKQLRRKWGYIIDLQCSGRTAKYRMFFVPKSTRWIGTAQNSTIRLPDFTGVNNRDRMVEAIKLVGGLDTSVNVNWLLSKDADLLRPSVSKYVVFVPGCSPHRLAKRWPADFFSYIGQWLHEKNIDVVLVGTASDQPVIEQIMGSLPNAINYCGKTTIPQLAGLFVNAQLVIGNDTGPMFLAAKSDIPTVVLTGAETTPSAVMSSGKNAVWMRKDEIADITPEEVIETINDIFDQNL
jgi:ADP-heptose:LPS heptosyltransferase